MHNPTEQQLSNANISIIEKDENTKKYYKLLDKRDSGRKCGNCKFSKTNQFRMCKCLVKKKTTNPHSICHIHEDRNVNQ